MSIFTAIVRNWFQSVNTGNILRKTNGCEIKFNQPNKNKIQESTFLRKLSATIITMGMIVASLEAQNCTCPNNLITNPSFEGNVSGWSMSPSGTFTWGTGFQQCGSNNAFLNATGGAANFWQQVNGASSGTAYTLTFYAGTHEPSLTHQVRIRFYSSANAILQTNSKEIDFDVDGAGGALQLYTINATAPANAAYLRVEGTASGDYIKIDQVCLTSSCNNVTDGGTIAANQSGCGSSFDPAPFTNVTSPTGGSGVIEYMWLESTTTCTVGDPGWNTVVGATSATYDAPAVSETTCYMRCSRRAGCTNWDGESNVITITVNPSPAVDISGTTNICNGGSTTLTASGSGGTSPYTYAWSNGLGSGASKTVNPTTTTTYTVVVTDSKGCTATSAVTVTVNQCTCTDNLLTNHSLKMAPLGGVGVEVILLRALMLLLKDCIRDNFK